MQQFLKTHCAGLITRTQQKSVAFHTSCAKKNDVNIFKTETKQRSKELLIKQYNAAKELCNEKLIMPTQVRPTDIFANNQVCFSDVDVFGFDYDYTLVVYNRNLHYLIYNMTKDCLVNKFMYPSGIQTLNYDPHFAIRGLHCDVKRGLMMKIDAFHKIQLGSVYRGLERVGDEEVKRIYGGAHVPLQYMSDFHGAGETMVQLVDWFAAPQMCLLAHVAQYFKENAIEFDPSCLFHDIDNCVQDIHVRSPMKNVIMNDCSRYLKENEQLKEMFEYLIANGKKIFLASNSSFRFIDRGMRHMLGDDWTKYFDIVIAEARKPNFFDEAQRRPFRSYDLGTGQFGWGKVARLVRGEVYVQGNVTDLCELTGWSGERVLYCGDHVYTDLAEPSVRHGWRTLMVIPELAREIRVQSDPTYRKNLVWLLILQRLVDANQDCQDPEILQLINEWRNEIMDHINESKRMFNQQFGSCFHSFTNATYFTRRLVRYSDLYTSSCSNLANYSLSHIFYPQRITLPHESSLHMPWFVKELLYNV